MMGVHPPGPLLPLDLSALPQSTIDAVCDYILRWELTAEANELLRCAGLPEPRSQRDSQRRIQLLLLAGQADAALGLARELQQARANVSSSTFLADCLLQVGDLHEAQEVARNAVAEFPERMSAWCALGRALHRAGYTSEARVAFEQALQLRPDSPMAMEALAECGPAEAAITYYERALATADPGKPTPVRLYRNLARLKGEDQWLWDQLRFFQKRELDDLVALLPLAGHTRQAQPLPTAPLEADGDELTRALQTYFGHDGFRPGQREVIEAVLGGQDTLALMPTGAGKSLCYQLPAVLLPGATLVISPLIALMKDQVDSLPREVFAQTTAINSSMPPEQVNARLEAIRHGQYKLIYVAPERLRQHTFVEALQGAPLSLAVIDEAHCVSVWGHDFRPDYLFIGRALDQLGRPPILAMTATATAEVAADIQTQLGRTFKPLRTGVVRPNLHYDVLRCRSSRDKEAQLMRLLAETPGSAIVYATARERCQQLADTLTSQGLSAAAFHARLPNEVKTSVQERFMLGEIRVVVATIAFGMGVDKANIRLVVHFNLPRSVEAYTQESGRAGRDGKPARCTLLYDAHEVSRLYGWAENEVIEVEELRNLYGAVKRTLAGEREGLVRVSELETATKLDYRIGLSVLEAAGLAERSWDWPGARLQLRLPPADDSARHRLAGLLARAHAARVQEIDAIAAYAEGTSCRQRFLAQHFGVDLQTVCGECDRCRAGRHVTVPKRGPSAPAKGPSADELERFENLRTWRHVQAEREKVPDYLLFPDTILRELARVNPKNWRLLRAIAGGDAYKLDKFGDDILAVLARSAT